MYYIGSHLFLTKACLISFAASAGTYLDKTKKLTISE